MDWIVWSLRFLRAMGHLLIIEPLCDLVRGRKSQRDSEW